MKNILALFLTAITCAAFSQNKYYSYPPELKLSDAPHFFNADSILSAKKFQTLPHEYKNMDKQIANYDMEVLGELHGAYFTKELDHTFIRDIDILQPPYDTILFKQRAFVYKDSAEANKVFKHLSEKVVSAISVPDYRIIYKEMNAIYFISVQSYEKKLKQHFPAIIYPIYDALATDKKHLYLLFKHDLRIKTNR
ncbi:MAG: hypothetical protein HY063_10580 [Bacteroidetes bacterium]|nr:hypothetical protein [Bacteroidota bacterium]